MRCEESNTRKSRPLFVTYISFIFRHGSGDAVYNDKQANR